MVQVTQKRSLLVQTKKNKPKKNKTKRKTTANPKNKGFKKQDIKVCTPKPKTATSPQNPLGHLLLEKLLKEEGFTGEVVSDETVLEEYSTDESIFSITPQLIIRPKSNTDVEIVVKTLSREKEKFPSLSLTPRAAGTGLSGGSLTDSVVLDVDTYLNEVGDIAYNSNSKEAFVTVDSGTRWRDMEAKLAKIGYYVPTYTSSKDICSVGGAVANNAAGAETLKYGHCVDWIDSLQVVLADGNAYTIEPLTYKQFSSVIKKKNEYARILREVYDLLEENEAEIKKNKPHTKKNTAGYNIWNLLPQGTKKFAQGEGKINPLHLVAGSQGTLGIVTSVTMRAVPIIKDATTIFVPLFDLYEAAEVIENAKKLDPIDMEVFDDKTFDLALRNPDFFKKRLEGLTYYRTMLSMYTLYHVRFARKLPELMMLITVSSETAQEYGNSDLVKEISGKKNKARIITNPIEEGMLWQIRRASYSLSKLQDTSKRPAAFLEDMTVPTKHLPKFFTEIKRLFREFNVQATVHGHAGNGHFHFYPLLDFTQKTTPKLIEKMSEKFFATALRYEGNICGEHNDGIIRTPHLHKMFSEKMLTVFNQLENIFDPIDIFNPGKKVNPRFEIREVLRTKNK